MKIGLDLGHNCPPDTGASGIKKEDAVIMEVGKRVHELLLENGHAVVLCRPNGASSVNASLRSRVSRANNERVDLFVSIHGNAFNRKAHGSEVFVSSPSSPAALPARRVLNNLVKLGFRDRGVKPTRGLYVINNTDAPAMLIEICFIDSEKDIDIYNAAGVESVAFAIVQGLLGNPVKPSDKTTDDEPNYAILQVMGKTYLKPSTEQASVIGIETLDMIEVGSYPVELLIDEEGHYHVKFVEKSKFVGNQAVLIREDIKGEWWVFAGHCKLIDV